MAQMDKLAMNIISIDYILYSIGRYDCEAIPDAVTPGAALTPWYTYSTNVPAARTAAELLSPVIRRYRAWRKASSEIGSQVKLLSLPDPRLWAHYSIFRRRQQDINHAFHVSRSDAPCYAPCQDIRYNVGKLDRVAPNIGIIIGPGCIVRQQVRQYKLGASSLGTGI